MEMDPELRKRAREILDRDMDRTDPVSVQRYTRKGNLKRPGSGADGKGNTHPNSLAALNKHRAATQFNGPNARRCKYCRRLAVRELDVCYFHGGAAYLRAKRRSQGKGAVGKTSQIALRNTRKIFAEGLLPDELLRNPLFRDVARVALPIQMQTPRDEREKDIGRRINARVLVRELAAAWFAYLDGDYKPWLAATQKAKAMGFRAGP